MGLQNISKEWKNVGLLLLFWFAFYKIYTSVGILFTINLDSDNNRTYAGDNQDG